MRYSSPATPGSVISVAGSGSISFTDVLPRGRETPLPAAAVAREVPGPLRRVGHHLDVGHQADALVGTEVVDDRRSPCWSYQPRTIHSCSGTEPDPIWRRRRDVGSGQQFLALQQQGEQRGRRHRVSDPLLLDLAQEDRQVEGLVLDSTQPVRSQGRNIPLMPAMLTIGNGLRMREEWVRFGE